MNVRVVGFEGVVAPRRVPARLAPILVDEVGRRVLAQGNELHLLSDMSLVLPETATALDPLPYESSATFLVLGEDDLSTWRKAVEDGRLGHAPDHFSSAMRWVHDGAYCAWLCQPAEANKVLSELRDNAIRQAARAIAEGQQAIGYELAWRIVRCAVDDADIYVAAAVLRQSSYPEQAEQLILSYFAGYRLLMREIQLAKGRLIPETCARCGVARSVHGAPFTAGNRLVRSCSNFQSRSTKTETSDG